MFAWPLKTSCLTHKEKPKIRAVKGRTVPVRKSKDISRSKGKKGRTQRLPLIEPFVKMSSSIAKDNDTDKSDELSDNSNETTIKVTNPHQSTPISSKETGYRLRNHSYQQSVGGELTTMHKSGEPNGKYQKKYLTTTEEDLDEMGSLEDLLPPKVLLKKQELEKKNNPGKFDAIFDSVNKLYNMHAQVTARMKSLEFAVFDKDDGIPPQLQGLAVHAKDAGDKQELITKEVLELREELDIAKGLIQKQNKQIKALKSRQVDLIARSMSENLTIAGIKGDAPKADTKALLYNFLDEQMGIDLDENEEITAVHRLGLPAKNYN